jgi:hypothetical protein
MCPVSVNAYCATNPNCFAIWSTEPAELALRCDPVLPATVATCGSYAFIAYGSPGTGLINTFYYALPSGRLTAVSRWVGIEDCVAGPVDYKFPPALTDLGGVSPGCVKIPLTCSTGGVSDGGRTGLDAAGGRTGGASVSDGGSSDAND